MNFDLDSNQKMIQEMIREFARNELKEKAAEIDKSGEFPWKNVQKLANLGILGMIIPESFGGGNMDFISFIIAVEEIAKACASTALVVSINQLLCAYTFVLFGTDGQKKKYIPSLINGEKIGAFAMTELNAGSDMSAMATSAVLKNNQFILNGSKRLISNGKEAGIILVLAKTDMEKGYKGISLFIVEKETPGFSTGKEDKLMGFRATSNCELLFENCKIPKEDLIGQEGQGFKIAMQMLDSSRISMGALAVGIAQAALDEAIQYSKERVTFGKPICQHQMIQDKIAQMGTRIDAARLLMYRAAYLKDRGVSRFTKEAAIAKYFAADTCIYVTREALQIFGGYGYATDYPVERYYREAKLMEIGEGTSEINLMVIARNILGS